ncbi:hypothetical protein ACFFX0_20260 [Citricoccus parietis]|uniref:Uncharacterized protein n=1 Tax=Citricoccus parietis TaxID=592307 RepID=A0ABV5G3A2_9MICC
MVGPLSMVCDADLIVKGCGLEPLARSRSIGVWAASGPCTGRR